MSNKPTFMLATAPGCPHCPVIKKLAQEFEQQQLLSSLKIIDISQDPEFAAQHNIRSVPWIKISDFVFTGVHGKAELEFWLQNADTETGIRRYIIEQLDSGKLGEVEKLFTRHPDWLQTALPILADPLSPIQARLGLTAILEGMTDQETLASLLPTLSDFAKHADHRVRADACHLLALIDTAESRRILERALQDENEEVREIAQESLEQLNQ